MKRLIFLLTVLIATSLCSFAQTKQTLELKTRAITFITLLEKGDFVTAEKNFDATMQTAMPKEKLMPFWASVHAQMGKLRSYNEVELKKQGQYDQALVTCTFEKDGFILQLTFDASQKIAGLHTLPKKMHYSPPVYADSTTFTEENVVISTPGYANPLSAWFSRPKGKGPFPAIVLLSGSGPNDLDETVGPNKPFKDIAWGLASRGIAVLRYSKRTKQYPGEFIGKRFTVKDEVTDDALTALGVLRSRNDVDPQRVYLLGHSLGAYVAPRIARVDSTIAGIVMMASPSQALEDVINEQLQYMAMLDTNYNANYEEGRKIRSGVQALSRKDLTRDTLIFGVPPSYWLDLRGYLPQDLVKQLKMPVLILQGGRDYQVNDDNFLGLKDALRELPNVTFTYYKKLNHLFIVGKGQSTPSEYDIPGHVALNVIEDIVKFITPK